MTPRNNKSNKPDFDVRHHAAATIKKIRLAAGMSQGALGTLVGVTYQQIQKYESAQDEVGLNRLAEITDVLNVPLRDFFEPDVWGRDLSRTELKLLLAIRRNKSEEHKAALATILGKRNDA